jgi:hypothetical protein
MEFVFLNRKARTPDAIATQVSPVLRLWFSEI